MAAGRFHLPAVAVCWMKESYDSADIERWVVGERWPDDPEGWLLAEGRLRFAL